MRVAVFEPNFLTPRPNAASCLVLLQNQVKALAKQGEEVIVLTERKGALEPKEDCVIYPIQGKLTAFSRHFSAARRTIPTYSDFFSPEIISKSVGILRKLRVDVIYTCSSSFSAVFSAILGRMTNTPTVNYVFHCITSWRWWREEVDVLGFYNVPLKRVIGEFAKNSVRELSRRDFVQKWGLRNTNRVVASSNFVRDALSRLAPEMKNIPVMYPGVNIPVLNGVSSSDTQAITYFGHLWQGRGVLDLITAFSLVVKRHPKVKLVVAATNVHQLTERCFRKLINEYGLGSNIIWKGIVNDVHSELLASSKLIVLPYRDIPSIKLIESMAAAKPVVTTKIGWAPELISDGESGFLVKVGDVEGIANRINMLLDDAELAEEVGRNAREVVKEKCDLEANARVLSDILREASLEEAK